MNNFETIMKILEDLVKEGIVIREDKNLDYSHQECQTTVVKLGEYTIHFVRHYNPETKEYFSCEAYIVRTKSENDIVDFDIDEWYNNTRIISQIIYVRGDRNGYYLSTYLPLSRGTNQRSFYTAPLEGDATYASRDTIRKLHILHNASDYKTMEEEEEKLKMSCPVIPSEIVLKGLSDLDFDGLEKGFSSSSQNQPVPNGEK